MAIVEDAMDVIGVLIGVIGIILYAFVDANVGAIFMMVSIL